MLERDHVFMDVEAGSTDELFELLGQRMIDRGFAKETFIQGLKDREAEFPTGLAIEEHAIAIPHTYPEHIENETIVVASLKEPVDFIMMSTDDVLVPAKIVFMLLLKSKNQVPMLQQIMGIIQDKEMLSRLYAAKSGDELYDILKTVIATPEN